MPRTTPCSLPARAAIHQRVDPATLVDPTGPPTGNALLIRGGSYDNDWVKARSASRLGTRDLGSVAADIGFRCVRSVIQ